MEIRVLKYFLMVAREENITKAANLLHITQPTLSRQLIQLEEELGTTLFHRSKYRIVLTEDGMLLKRRAQEIIELADKAKKELSREAEALSGEIFFGCAETRNMTFLSRKMAAFREKYPLVHYNIYSATADDLKDRIEKGLLDICLFTEPVDIGKYEFLRLEKKEVWGVLVRKDSPLASKETVTPEDLAKVPLLMSRREMVQNELANWFGDFYDQLDVAANYNLILNAADMVKNHIGVALCFYIENISNDLCFIPFSPALETGAVLAWKKNFVFSAAATKFIHYIKDSIF